MISRGAEQVWRALSGCSSAQLSHHSLSSHELQTPEQTDCSCSSTYTERAGSCWDAAFCIQCSTSTALIPVPCCSHSPSPSLPTRQLLLIIPPCPRLAGPWVTLILLWSRRPQEKFICWWAQSRKQCPQAADEFQL